MRKSFFVGQRWLSEAEPELGLGIIIDIDVKTVMVYFPATKTERRFAIQSAPLKRIKFEVGDEITTGDFQTLKVTKVEEQDGLVKYFSNEILVNETQLSDQLTFKRPDERLLAGTIDSLDFFSLRYQALLHKRAYLVSSTRGFLGPKVNLIPHQFYVAKEIASRSQVRVMLADEVGLGKTIEAGLIIHHLLLCERINRVLIIVPDSLVYQWFFELRRKFQMNCLTLNQDSDIDLNNNIFEDHQLFIISLKYLMKNEQLLDDVKMTSWDLMVVDEAHQLKWSTEKVSEEYQLIETMSHDIPHIILLSGTPEILGMQGHFARLKLLDPQRFHRFDKFVEENQKFQQTSSLAKKIESHQELTGDDVELLHELKIPLNDTVETKLKKLIDRHGTGRIYFRNSRKHMSRYTNFFPKRKLWSYPLELKKSNLMDVKAKWLASHLENFQHEKTLLIIHDRESLLLLEKKLKSLSGVQMAIFHAGMSLIERDRQVAYFSQDNGASLLLTTEVGSEGRNFEFAQHLVLFDLPKLPDLLEQRIGRLDRIGQKNLIQIHVPFIKNGAEEIWFRWYHEGLNAFETSPRGAIEVYGKYKDILMSLVENEVENIDQLDEFYQSVRNYSTEVEKKLDQGQDILLELNSFNQEEGLSFIHDLQQIDSSPDLKNFIFNIFDLFGVDYEDIQEDLWFIKPGVNMYMPSFPGLSQEGMLVTFNRSFSLKRDDVVFITWDHELVQGIIDFIESKEVGNVTVVESSSVVKESFLLEGFFLFSVKASKELDAEKYFPPTPIRVILNDKKIDMTAKIPKKMLDENILKINEESLKKIGLIPKQTWKDFITLAKGIATKKASQYQLKFFESMNSTLDSEVNRLKYLKEVNPLVSNHDIEVVELKRKNLSEASKNAQLHLDSLRIILK